MIRIAAAREESAQERRAPCSPETARRYASLGGAISIEKGLGAEMGFEDSAYKEAGAAIASDAAQMIGEADILLTVRPPSEERVARMKRGGILVGLLDPFGAEKRLKSYSKQGLTVFALELLPRISRAQSMDALSSQSNLAGYRAVIEAAAASKSAMPMMMTAAGTVAPSRLFVMGAGVAGLQAIATARRLGAIVSATDIRAAAKEQVESLGADFIMVEESADGAGSRETEGGYAREADEDYRERQAALVSEHLKKQDIVICTALVPGRPAPKLISADMVRLMRPGSVIVDLAAEQGGNCELSERGKAVRKEGVLIIAYDDMTGRVAADATSLYARNLFHFIQTLIDSDKGEIAIAWDDELVKETALVREGEILKRDA